MKNWLLGLSILLNLVLVALLVFLNDRYGLWAKVQRVALEEGRVPGVAASYELNRNYQVRREMFRLDKNESARVLMLGDSLTAQGEWNAMLGKPLVANRGIDGDTSAGVLARIGDDADFGGDAVVIWIGTNDVLQGGAAGPVAERIMEAARGKAEILKSEKLKVGRPAADGGGLIADGEAASQPRTDGGGRRTEEKAEKLKLGKAESGDFLDAGPSSLDTGSPATSHPLLATAPQAQIFVLGTPPMARWWEGARERNAVIREINARLAAGSGENGYRFIELETTLADENGFLRGDMTSDGVHLSAMGYVAVIQRLKEACLWPRTED